MKIKSIEGLREDFLESEKENSLFDLEIEGVKFWERMRFNIYRDLVEELGLRESDSSRDTSASIYSILKIFYLSLRNIFYKNPLFGEKAEILFYGHRRRKNCSGSAEDIYCDQIISNLDLDYLYLEEPNNFKHENPRAEKIRYLDFTKYVPKILYRLIKPFYNIKQVQKLDKIEENMAGRYGVEKNLAERVQKTIFVSKVEKKLNKLYLKKLNPEVAVFLVSYGRENQIEACKELGITTVELQHGVIDEGHMGYNYPEGKESFPDYLFTFGDYWKESANFPIKDEKIVSIGYPYLEREIDRYNDIESEDQVLFISQKSIGKEISKVAAKLSKIDKEYQIVYKLHPTEYEDWREKYPWLEDSNIKVVDNDKKSLYELFAESKTQVGVYSTAVYEGLAAGLETIIVDMPGSERMARLTNSNICKQAKNVEEVDELICFDDNPSCQEFFKSGSIENFSQKISWLN